MKPWYKESYVLVCGGVIIIGLSTVFAHQAATAMARAEQARGVVRAKEKEDQARAAERVRSEERSNRAAEARRRISTLENEVLQQEADRKKEATRKLCDGAIEELQLKGLIGSLRLSSYGLVSCEVTPRFSRLSFVDKKTVTGLCLAWGRATNPKAHGVILKDSRSGKKVGQYSLELGLEMF